MSNGIQEKSLATVVSELKLEFSDFIQTRYQMLASELKSNLSMLKLAAPMLVVALLLCVAAFTLLTAALVGLIAIGMGADSSAWTSALAIVGGGYLIIGGIAGVFGWRRIAHSGLAPARTMRVLKQDQVWLQNEVRSQL